MKFNYGGHDMSDYIYGYRADPTGKFGGKDRMETTPHELNRSELYDSVRALVESENLGAPRLSTQQIANMVLHEGRTDLGYNHGKGFTRDNPKYAKIYNKLQEQGHDFVSAGIPAAVTEKMDTAKRTGLPFELLWNGKGKVRGMDRTGADYQKEADEMRYAAEHPKNKELISFINKAKADNFTPQEFLANNINNLEISNAMLNNMRPDELRAHLINNTSGNVAGYLKNIDPGILNRAALNQFRVMNGIEPISPVVDVSKKAGLMPRGSISDYNISTLHTNPTDVQTAAALVEHPEVKAQLQTLYAPFIKQMKLTPQASQQDAAPEPLDASQTGASFKKGGLIDKPIKGGWKII